MNKYSQIAALLSLDLPALPQRLRSGSLGLISDLRAWGAMARPVLGGTAAL